MIAHSKGKSWFLWMIYGQLMWPIALVHILLVKEGRSGITPLPAGKPVTDDRECQKCAELTKKKAKKCKHCGCALEPQLENLTRKRQPQSAKRFGQHS